MTVVTDAAVFHICPRTAVDVLRAAGEYRADSLEREGFIHLSRANQVLPTARAYFAGVPDLVLLVIDAAALGALLVYAVFRVFTGGFTPSCFQAGRVDQLTAKYPNAAAIIARLGVTDGDTRMPDNLLPTL